jgi:drug/metabolite transporter (DMT)-like permease
LPSLRANRRGIAALLSAMAAFTVNDALTKIVVQAYPAGEIMFARGLITVAMLGASLAAMRQIRLVPSAARPPVILRSVFDAAASGLFITALGHMGIAELSAIVLASPLIMTMLAVLLFKEPVGWRRWAAIVAGLAGTMLVVKPVPSALDVWALLGLGAAFGAAARDLATLRISPGVPTLAVAMYSALALTSTGLLLGARENWLMLESGALVLLAAAAFLYSIATYLLVLAFRSVDVSVVSPFRYGLLIFSGGIGFLVFGEIPDLWSVAGAGLIVASGIYTLHRETVRHRYLSARPTTEP